jgi:acyl carrier protein
MNSFLPQHVRSYVLNSIEELLQTNGVAEKNIDDNFDLLVQGGLGSFDFLHLIISIQEKFGVELDFEQLDPEKATILGTLCQYISDRTQPGASQSGN